MRRLFLDKIILEPNARAGLQHLGTEDELQQALEDLVASLPPEKRLAGLPPEERLRGLTLAERERLLLLLQQPPPKESDSSSAK